MIDRIGTRVSVVVLLVTASACDRTASPVAVDSEVQFAVSQPAAARQASLDDRWAALDDRLPGFAGAFLEDGRFIVRRKGEAFGAIEAREAVRAFLGGPSSGPVRDAIEDATASLELRSAEYGFRELQDWRVRLRSLVFASRLGHSLRIDERTNRIVVNVHDTESRDRLLDALPALSVPLEALTISIQESETRDDISLTSAVSPRLGGLQVSRNSIGDGCTLGFNLTRLSSNERYFITAAHCTWTPFYLGGDQLGQPQAYSNTIGTEVSDPARFSGGACPSGKVCRYSDAAVIQYSSAISSTYGYVANPPTGSTNYTSTVPVYWSVPYDGHDAHMVGHVSGSQWGEVLDTCVDKEWAGGTLFLCLMSADYDSEVGDSGAPVMTWHIPMQLGVRVAAGIHLGRDLLEDRAYFSSLELALDEIEADLGGATFCFDYASNPCDISVGIGGPNFIDSAGSYQWAANTSGGSGSNSYSWQYRPYGGAWYTVGSTQTYQDNISSLDNPYFDLKVTVTSGGDSATAERRITVQIGGCNPCE